ncbi:MAG: T9SS type A sorting domain-containing protein [Aureispira sp.]|nr:T9SS type A sorting domain-containing protein [Aureispira sp.]
MTKLNILVTLFFLWAYHSLDAQIVTIPDANFKAALVANTSINTNGDTEIQVSEAAAFSGIIDVNSKSISDLTGIEAFTTLTQLNCRSNQLTNLNISNNTALTYLTCYSNQLDSLNISNNTALTYLKCHSNQLDSLNISNNTALTNLQCNNNQLTSLNVSNNTALILLRCDDNQLTNLNIANNTALNILNCGGNPLTNLNVANNTTLFTLICDNNQLTSLDVSNNTTLTRLDCYSNQLTSLDLSNNTDLIKLWCHFNPLGNLDLSNHTALTSLSCNSTQLTSLNVKNGNNTNFTYFSATSNPNLTCIQVDDPTYSTTNWTNKDATATYSTACLTNVERVANKAIEITAFPNPTQGAFSIQLDKSYSEVSVQVYNTTGKQVFAQNYTSAQYLELDLDEAATGMYMVKVQTADGDAVLKVLKD